MAYGGDPRPAQRIQDLRKGSRTTPVPSGKTYRRRPKHRKAEEG